MKQDVISLKKHSKINSWVWNIKTFVGFWIILNTYLFYFAKVAGFVYISAFASSVGIPVGTTSSAVRLTNVQQLPLLNSIS